MAILPPHSFPLGGSLPPNDIHAVSVSLPTWEEVLRYMKGEESINEKLESNYPRFYQHKVVSKLNDTVLSRVKAHSTMRCAIYPSEDSMRRCSQYLRKHASAGKLIQEGKFQMNAKSAKENTIWGKFFVVLFPEEYEKHAVEFWAIFGDGISSRHASFCLERFDFMSSTSTDPLLITSAINRDVQKLPDQPWNHCDSETKKKIKSMIAKWATSGKAGQEPVNPQDIFLYSKGMSAIGTLTRSLVAVHPDCSEAVVFGWPYGSTPKCIRESGFDRFTFYDQGSSEELDLLEASLACGRLISCLFCEVPSNPLGATPDLHRIRRLADQYNFVVVCDETIGTFINIDIMPYVDVVVTSLTKAFSGACNVMGGSLILNRKSAFYDELYSTLSRSYEDVIYPLEAKMLLQNCLDFPARVQKASRNGVAIASFLNTHNSIFKVNYPSLVKTAPLYEKYRRSTGGYGYLISIVFKNPKSAPRFYDSIDLCKGPSLGTNFTLLIPYAQLAHVDELDWAESRGVPQHIVRISVGLEDEGILLEKFDRALKDVEIFEKSATA